MAVGIINPNKQLLLSGILQSWGLFWALLAASLVDKVDRPLPDLRRRYGRLFQPPDRLFDRLYRDPPTTCRPRIHRVHFLVLQLSQSFLPNPSYFLLHRNFMSYSLRAKGLAIYYFAAFLASIINQYVQPPIGLGPFYWNIVYVAVLTSQAVFLSYFIIETKNCTLEDSGTLFDGDSVIEPDVFPTSNITHNGDDDKISSRFHVWVK